jgi:hypothetical protein
MLSPNKKFGFSSQGRQESELSDCMESCYLGKYTKRFQTPRYGKYLRASRDWDLWPRTWGGNVAIGFGPAFLCVWSWLFYHHLTQCCKALVNEGIIPAFDREPNEIWQTGYDFMSQRATGDPELPLPTCDTNGKGIATEIGPLYVPNAGNDHPWFRSISIYWLLSQYPSWIKN